MNATLLIVEDNVKMRNLIKDMFAPIFKNIYECDDGSKALKSYALSKPEWVFMDLKMKEMDGIAATKEIISKYPDAKILIVTDFNDDELRKVAARNGAIDYVLKENLEEIFKIINKQ
ncbi:MAG: Transcriptional regulatory protein DegU [Ignavibacteria bacterium]|nr:Transcriptional regulatory protein DegU [Ignavibacteria bacterium]